MSVILDALHKARADRKTGRTEGLHEQTVARVVDAAAVEAAAESGVAARQSRQREWLIAFGVIVALIILFAMAAGAFLLIYQQLRQIGGNVGAAAAARAPESREAAASALINAPVVTEALPTPVPVSELPVQPPAAASAGGAFESAQGNAAPLASPEDFTLGSIVCENNDCLASLNGRSVQVGDVVRGYEIIAIDTISVKLRAVNGGHELALSLFD